MLVLCTGSQGEEGFSSFIKFSVGGRSMSVVFVMRVFVQVRARTSEILVNSDLNEKTPVCSCRVFVWCLFFNEGFGRL